jgi:hypothetical protein
MMKERCSREFQEGWKEPAMETRDPTDESAEELLRHDHYDPEELSRLLDMNVNRIRRAAFSGELKAYVIGHHIVTIRRADAVRWLQEREQR